VSGEPVVATHCGESGGEGEENNDGASKVHCTKQVQRNYTTCNFFYSHKLSRKTDLKLPQLQYINRRWVTCDRAQGMQKHIKNVSAIPSQNEAPCKGSEPGS
jgi:hypothetical protein